MELIAAYVYNHLNHPISFSFFFQLFLSRPEVPDRMQKMLKLKLITAIFEQLFYLPNLAS